MANFPNEALLIGIDHYHWRPLKGCVADAEAMQATLAYHDDGSPNFDCSLLTSADEEITESRMREAIKAFFKKGRGEIGILYFSGHGGDGEYDNYLMGQDAEKYDVGLSFTELMKIVHHSEGFREILIILDCCHAGGASQTGVMLAPPDSQLTRHGTSILMATLPSEYAWEREGRGVFSRILEMGLRGNAADLLGEVDASKLFHYADQMLGSSEQVPMFKSQVTGFNPLRKCTPKMERKKLDRLVELFPDLDHQFALSPEYEPTEKPKSKKKEAVFKELQAFTRSGLVEPVGEEHMYYAALNSKTCQLTNAGKAYWTIQDYNWVK